MIHLLILQLTESLLGCNDSIFKILDSIYDIVVCNASLYNIIVALHFAAFTAINYIFKPFNVIALENFNAIAGSNNCIYIKRINR